MRCVMASSVRAEQHRVGGSVDLKLGTMALPNATQPKERIMSISIDWYYHRSG